MTETQVAGALDTLNGTGTRDRSRTRTFSWEDPTLAAGRVGHATGLEMLRSMIAGELPPPPIMKTLDFDRIEALGEGRVDVYVTPQEFHYNPLGTVHGGVFATMLDSACGCAVHTMLPAGVFYTSLDLSLKFLRPVTVDTGPITAEATVIHFGRRTALAEGRITDAAGKVYVTATSSCLVMRSE